MKLFGSSGVEINSIDELAGENALFVKETKRESQELSIPDVEFDNEILYGGVATLIHPTVGEASPNTNSGNKSVAPQNPMAPILMRRLTTNQRGSLSSLDLPNQSSFGKRGSLIHLSSATSFRVAPVTSVEAVSPGKARFIAAVNQVRLKIRSGEIQVPNRESRDNSQSLTSRTKYLWETANRCNPIPVPL